MGSKTRKRLEATVTAIQRRWGIKALSRGWHRPALGRAISHIPSGFSALDRALDGVGGIPRGRLTEILAEPTSGMATLALKIIVQAQAVNDQAVYLDLASSFDPDYAARCGVNLARLLLVRPPTPDEALEIVQALIAGRGPDVLIFDAVSCLLTHPGGNQVLSAVLRQLPALLAQSSCALIFLTPLQFGGAMSMANYPSGFALPHYAALRLLLKKERWLYKRDDVRGYRAQVTVLKNKFGASGRRATIEITFNGVVTGDST